MTGLNDFCIGCDKRNDETCDGCLAYEAKKSEKRNQNIEAMKWAVKMALITFAAIFIGTFIGTWIGVHLAG